MKNFIFKEALPLYGNFVQLKNFYWLYSSFPVMDQLWKYLWKAIYWFGWKHCNWGHPDLFLQKGFAFTWSVTYTFWEHCKHRKLQKGKVSQENQLCITGSPIPNTWNTSARLINTSVLLCLQCDWFGPRAAETEQWGYLKPGQSRKKEISVFLCTKFCVENQHDGLQMYVRETGQFTLTFTQHSLQNSLQGFTKMRRGWEGNTCKYIYSWEWLQSSRPHQ